MGKFFGVESSKILSPTVTTREVSVITPATSSQALSAKGKSKDKEEPQEVNMKGDGPNPFDAITKAGLAGILAITLAEAIFWALGYPAALIYYKLTANEWIDVFSKDGILLILNIPMSS